MPGWQPSTQSCILRSLHSIRRLTKLPHNKDGMSRGEHVREDDDALPYLEACHIRCVGGTTRRRGRARHPEEIDPGATDTEIKIGNIMPYSGPASAYATIGKTEAAYFNKINSEGGINGRKINFISYDDGYNPAKTVEQARKLVEADEVLSCSTRSARPATLRSRNT
jgi:ABC-type branched-subunit amino acid transport system substrate-binding protein